MPTYEYACLSCKKSYETREGFDAPSTHTCQQCGEGIAKRVLHAPRIVFKGNGFYSTDSRSKSTAHVGDTEPGKNGAKPDTDTSAEKPTAKKESKSNTKPAKTTEPTKAS